MKILSKEYINWFYYTENIWTWQVIKDIHCIAESWSTIWLLTIYSNTGSTMLNNEWIGLYFNDKNNGFEKDSSLLIKWSTFTLNNSTNWVIYCNIQYEDYLNHKDSIYSDIRTIGTWIIFFLLVVFFLVIPYIMAYKYVRNLFKSWIIHKIKESKFFSNIKIYRYENKD